MNTIALPRVQLPALPGSMTQSLHHIAVWDEPGFALK